MISNLIVVLTVLVAAQTLKDEHCDNATQCVGTDIYSEDDIWCEGTRACEGSTLSSQDLGDTSTFGCYGAWSCLNSPEIITRDSIRCYGMNSCENAVTTDSDFYRCDGHSSCKNSNITGSDTEVEGQGTLSLYNATINVYDGNFMEIEMFAYYAGYGLQIICHSGSSCLLFCYGNSCYGTTVYASNNAQFTLHCHATSNPDSDCPTIHELGDPVDFDLNLTAENSELWELEQFLSVDNLNEDLCDLDSDGNTGIICNNRTECASELLVVSDQNICCNGEFSCEDSDFTATNTDIYCLASQSCYANAMTMSSDNTNITNYVICAGFQSCFGTTILNTDNENKQAILYCMAHEACEDSEITNMYKIYCHAQYSCAGSVIKKVSYVYGSAFKTLKDTVINSDNVGTMVIYLNGKDAGTQEENGVYKPEEGLQIFCNSGDTCIVSCASTGCYQVNVTSEVNSIVDVYCDIGNGIDCPNTFGSGNITFYNASSSGDIGIGDDSSSITSTSPATTTTTPTTTMTTITTTTVTTTITSDTLSTTTTGDGVTTTASAATTTESVTSTASVTSVTSTIVPATTVTMSTTANSLNITNKTSNNVNNASQATGPNTSTTLATVENTQLTSTATATATSSPATTTITTTTAASSTAAVGLLPNNTNASSESGLITVETTVSANIIGTKSESNSTEIDSDSNNNNNNNSNESDDADLLLIVLVVMVLSMLFCCIFGFIWGRKELEKKKNADYVMKSKQLHANNNSTQNENNYNNSGTKKSQTPGNHNHRLRLESNTSNTGNNLDLPAISIPADSPLPSGDDLGSNEFDYNSSESSKGARSNNNDDLNRNGSINFVYDGMLASSLTIGSGAANLDNVSNVGNLRNLETLLEEGEKQVSRSTSLQIGRNGRESVGNASGEGQSETNGKKLKQKSIEIIDEETDYNDAMKNYEKMKSTTISIGERFDNGIASQALAGKLEEDDIIHEMETDPGN